MDTGKLFSKMSLNLNLSEISLPLNTLSVPSTSMQHQGIHFTFIVTISDSEIWLALPTIHVHICSVLGCTKVTPK